MRILALALLFLSTVPMLTKIFTSDFGTHIALGKHILQNRYIPTKELWNYPSLGMENGSGGEWGFQAVLYLVFSAGGEYAVSFLCWAVVIGIFSFLYRSAVLRGAHPLLAVLAIFAFCGFLRIRIQPRPEIFTYLFTSMTIFLLSEYYFGKRKNLIYLFPAMVLVWANMHPTYLMAFILCGAFFVDALARAAWKKELRWDLLKRWAPLPVAAAVAGLAICGLNPHGYSWLLAPLHMISRGAGAAGGGTASSVLMSISELTPVKGTGFFVYYKAALAFAVISLFLGVLGRRVYALDLFLFAIAFKGAWDSARAVSMMGLFLSPGVSLHMTGFLERAGEWFAPKPVPKRKTDGKEKAGKKGSRAAAVPENPRPVARPRVPAGQAVFIAVTVGAILVFGGTTVAFSVSQLQFGVGITEHKFSFRAGEFLRSNPVPGNMFNFFDIGGFLDWQLYPQALTFIDGRAYNRQVFLEHQTVTGAMAGWEEILQRYGVTYIVTKAIDSSGMVLPLIPALANNPNWTLVFSDGLFVIFVRNSPELQGYIKKHAIPKSVLPQHIISETYHYMYLGISRAVAYQTISAMYRIMGNQQAAVQTLRNALKEKDDPYLRSLLMQLEQGGAPRHAPR
jgi:hypothetical protein